MVAFEEGVMGQARRVALACHAHRVDQTGAAQLVQHSQRLEDTSELGTVGCKASHVVGRPATDRLEQHAQLCLELQTKRRATAAATAATAATATTAAACAAAIAVIAAAIASASVRRSARVKAHAECARSDTRSSGRASRLLATKVPDE